MPRRLLALSLADRGPDGLRKFSAAIAADPPAARDPRAETGRDGDAIVVAVDDYIYRGFSDAASIRAALAVDPDAAVQVEINSPGGSVYEGIAMMHLLARRAERTDVTAVIDGIAASAASVVAMGARRIEAASGAASFLAHRVWGLVVGSAGDMRETVAELEQLDGQLADIYSARSGIPRAEVLELMAEDRVMTAADAAERNLIDAVRGAPESEPDAAEARRRDDEDFRLRLELAAALQSGA